ncbi:MAG: PQQ-dependent sugar dehydrogenase [Nitrososphaeraceae archaeon]
MNVNHIKQTNKNKISKNINYKQLAFSTFTSTILILSILIVANTITMLNNQHQVFAAEKPPDLKVINSGAKPITNNLNVTTGYKIEPLYWNLTLPTSVTFDDKGNMYIAQAGFGEWFFATPIIIKVDSKGNTSIVADRMLYGPITDLEFYNGKIYISHKGVISTLDLSNEVIKDVIIGLPSSGDHQNNQIAFGPDGRLYISQGTATNSGVVGEDNILGLQWPKYTPQIHDIPPKSITLTGQNFNTSNPFTAELNDTATTGAFVPFNTATTKGQVIEGDIKCNGCILSAKPDGTDLQLVAWGLRNPYGLAFTNDGKLIVSNNGADERGSRQIANDPDKAYLIDISNSSQLGKFYGWPDYAGNAEPVTDPKFKSPNAKDPLKFLMQNHPKEVVKPLAQLRVGPSLTQNAVSNSSDFGNEGMVFIGASGTFTPITHTFETIDKGIVGHKIVMLNSKTGKYSDFISVIKDPAIFTPVGLAFDRNGSTLYVADLGKLELRNTLPTTGANLNHTVTWPYPYTGVIWKVTQSQGGNMTQDQQGGEMSGMTQGQQGGEMSGMTQGQSSEKDDNDEDNGKDDDGKEDNE